MYRIEKDELEDLLREYHIESTMPNKPTKMYCYYGDTAVWMVGLSYYHIIFDENEENFKFTSDYKDHVLDALSICGAVKMMVSFSSDSAVYDYDDWCAWFYEKIKNKNLVMDTNFILKHYFSSLILPRFQSSLKELSLYLPRMVVLEIERQGNQDKCKKDKATNAGYVEGKEKRLAFYGIREIESLRQLTDFQLIPLFDASLMTLFLDKAGKGFADAWIRKEIHDLTKKTSDENIIFITCDLMNSMAAEAEGIHSCYFSRLPQDNFELEDEKQFFNFILATAIIFGKIKLELRSNDDKILDCLEIEGVWNGKTTSDWFSDCLHFDRNETK
jgi:hypothetical protein